MLRAAHIDEFVQLPAGRYVVGATWLAWCATSTLCGTVLWGSPSEADIAILVRAWESDRALDQGFCVVSDLSRLTAVDPAAFDLLLKYVSGRLADHNRRVRRHALVRPSGLGGAAVAGFSALLAPQFEWRVLENAAEAFVWVGRKDAYAVVEELASGEAEGPLARLRALLAGDPQLDMHAAARELRLSRRSLQRRLAEDGTTFRGEAAQARLALACTLLTSTDDKLDEVARRVGLASGREMSKLFRRFKGETPLAWRARHRDST